MADFNYFLNRQGIRGLQGVKGDQGDSPIITVQTETPNEYILKITNPDGTELISPNLRGNKININEGTYVRYNTDTGELYTSTADGATGELAGVVRLATDADITDMDENSAVTPSQLADALSQYLVSPDSSVKIVQNVENSLTELTVEGGLKELPIASADTLGGVKIGENLLITEDGVLSSTASGDVSASGDNTFTGTNDFNGAVNLNGLTIAENLTVTRNLTSSGEINAVSIKSTGIHSDDIKTTTNKKYLTEEDVDNNTIQVVDGKLHADFDEVNREINDVSTRVTTLEGQVEEISTTIDSNTTDIEGLNKTKNDNIFDISKFTVVGNPTITDDGIASGFSSGNYINTVQLSELANKSWDIEGEFEYITTSTDNPILLGLTSLWAVRGALYYINNGTVRFAAYIGVTGDATSEGTKIELSNVLTTAGKYYYKLSFNLPTGKYPLSIYDSNKVLINSGEYTPPTTNKQLWDINAAPTTYVTISKTLSGVSDFIGTTDLKAFSITIDGEEVFNGLMSSTKPIYDKITTLNTNVSDFELETSNNFSAVNSALNEKANLSDVALKQNTLVEGDNITLTNNKDGTTTISASSTTSPTIELVDGGNASGGVSRAQVTEATSPLDNGAMPSVTVTVEDIQ